MGFRSRGWSGWRSCTPELGEWDLDALVMVPPDDYGDVVRRGRYRVNDREVHAELAFVFPNPTNFTAPTDPASTDGWIYLGLPVAQALDGVPLVAADDAVWASINPQGTVSARLGLFEDYLDGASSPVPLHSPPYTPADAGWADELRRWCVFPNWVQFGADPYAKWSGSDFNTTRHHNVWSVAARYFYR